MMRLNTKTTKAMVILHFCSLALWLGGVLSCLPLLFQIDIAEYDHTYISYVHMREIAWNVIGWGGIGGFVTGLILGIFTKWGLFTHKWVATKFFLVIGLILFGMFFNEHRILGNIELLESNGAEALLGDAFLNNHRTLKTGMWVSVIGFILLIVIAVYKPWMKKAGPTLSDHHH